MISFKTQLQSIEQCFFRMVGIGVLLVKHLYSSLQQVLGFVFVSGRQIILQSNNCDKEIIIDFTNVKFVKKYIELDSTICNWKNPKSCLCQVFNFTLTHFPNKQGCALRKSDCPYKTKNSTLLLSYYQKFADDRLKLNCSPLNNVSLEWQGWGFSL